MINIDTRRITADQLRNEVLPFESAEKKAKSCTTEELIHRLETDTLKPPVTEMEMKAYMSEADRRLKVARENR